MDGLITFGAAPQPTSSVSEPLPCAGACEGTDYGDDDGTTRGVDGVLAPFWADLDLGESGAVYVQAFAGSVVVQWDTVSYMVPRGTGPAGLRLRISGAPLSAATRACSGDLMVTRSLTLRGQGQPIFQNEAGTRFVFWWGDIPATETRGPRGPRWYCVDAMTKASAEAGDPPTSYYGFVPASSTPTQPIRYANSGWYVGGEWEIYRTSVSMKGE